MGDENPIRTLGDYSKPSHEGYRNTIKLPVGNNVVPLRSDTIQLVQKGCSFHGHRFEDPNQHLKDFLKLVDSLDLYGDNRERTRLRLFQFSLRDQATNWLERLPAGSITTWKDLTTRFLTLFFPLRRTVKLRNNILMFQQHHEESLSEAWTRFKDLLQKFPHHGIDLWLQVQIFYNYVNPVTRRTLDQSAGGKLRNLNAEESWALLEDLSLYDNEIWNDPRDFAKSVKAIALPQDVSSTFDRRLIELENQVQRLMEAYLAPTQPVQVNKVSSSCKFCSGPHDTQYCMKNPEQAFVDYMSSRINEVEGKRFTPNHGPRNFNDATNTWKEKPNINWEHTQTFTSPQGESVSVHSSSYQMKLEKALLNFDSNHEKRLSHLRTQLEQQQDDMIGKINLLWKTVSEKLNNVSTIENAGNSMTPKSIASISQDESEELRKKGIKSPSKMLSQKYLSPASIKELNKNPTTPKRKHFVNSIVILSTNSDTKEEDVSSTNTCDLNLGSMVKGKEEVKDQGTDESEMETDVEVDEVIEEEESEFETNEEVEEIFEEEEDDEDGENFNSFPTMEELTHHEWLLKNHRPP
ncbi:MAK10-like protein [Tanacetum coccineum]